LFTDVQGSVNRGPLAEGTGFTAGRRKPVCAGGRLNDAISMMRQQRKPVICARPPRGEQPARRSGGGVTRGRQYWAAAYRGSAGI